MNKRRVTPNLDADVVEALGAQGARSLSAAANDALRQAVSAEAHRPALLRWLHELDDAYGRPTEAQLAAADTLLDGAGDDAGRAGWSTTPPRSTFLTPARSNASRPAPPRP